MIIYQVKVKVKKSIEEDWFNWMSTKHIPDVINTGFFFDFFFFKQTANGKPDLENSTYVILYYCRSHEKLEQYFTTSAPALQNEHKARYGDDAVAERSQYEDITFSVNELA